MVHSSGVEVQRDLAAVGTPTSHEVLDAPVRRPGFAMARLDRPGRGSQKPEGADSQSIYSKVTEMASENVAGCPMG